MTLSEGGKDGETTSTPKEIERKWLVLEDLLPALDQYNGARIRQGYLVVDPEGNEARVRDKDGKHTLTVKSKGGLTRGEWETPLESEQFEKLWPATEGRRIEKTRYKIPHGQHTVELDVYEGELAGLMVAEVEFGTEGDAYAFEAPEWLGVDVTEDPQFKNQNLALHGLGGA